MKKNMRSIFILLLILLAITVTGCNKTEPVSEEPEAADIKDTVVEAFGTVEVKNTSSLTIDFPAAVKQVDVEAGQLVTAGQVMAVLDMSNISSSLRQQELEQQKLQNDLKTQQLLYDKNQKDLERRKALLNAGALTAADYEDYEIALFKSLNDIKGLEVSLAKTEAEKSKIQNQLNKTWLQGSSIICPYEKGVVSEVNCHAGDPVSPPRSLLTVLDYDSMYIRAEIPEEFIGDIRPDAKVIIVPVADNSKEYHGRVTGISHMAVNRNGETIIPVDISIDDADEFIKPKYNVDVRISTE